MRVPKQVLMALFAYPFLTMGQSGNYNTYQNPFSIPSAGLSATAGEPLTLNWTPTTSGTVSLILRSGASSNLASGATIASNIDNGGSYTWTPSSSITRGSDYTIEIVDDAEPTNTNYTPYFVIESDNTVASSTGEVTLGAPTSSIAVATASNTNTNSASNSVLSGTNTASSVTAAISSANSVASSAASSISAAVSSLSASVASSRSTASMTTSASSSQTDLQASASSTASAESTGAAPRITAAAGLMGVVALGAMVL
ncbi:hypothetical protein M8818_002709 [Zalaria obscura]|uniref:Uncharacterized protein n=1 Tax=Zalaria obscura TaxID=2024903 RepID=A0ACC3SH79_9PEZI